METINYEKVIEDLEAKRATFNTQIDSAIQGIRHVLSAVASLGTTPHVTASGVPGTGQTVPSRLSPDAFFGLGIAEAAIRFLQIVKRQQTTREIADGLEKANYHHTSKNFINTVNTALYRREKDEGDVVKIGRRWALAEWYPGRRKKTATSSSEEPVRTEATTANAESRASD